MKMEIGMIAAAAILGLAASVVILMGVGGREVADTGYNEADSSTVSRSSGTNVKTVEIHRAEDDDRELKDISECTVTMKEKGGARPGIEVRYGDETLMENEDYSVTYEKEPDSAGLHYVNIKMKGKYKGNRLLPYEIKPKAPSVSIGRIRTSDISVQWKAVDKCKSFELEYSLSKDLENAKKVSLKEPEKNEYLLKGLENNKTYYLRMRSVITNSDNKEVFSEWSRTEAAELKKIEVRDGVTYVDGILIVNKTYGLPSDYGSGEDPEAMKAFDEMCSAASGDGIYLYLASGYRSYSLQESIYNEFVDERGTEAADRVSARPGHSEHQTGLAIDINTTASSFNYTPEAAWIAEHCHEYGFTVRYPEDKEDITGYAYESWHVRYVGKDLSEKLAKEDLTLEEYYGLTSAYEN